MKQRSKGLVSFNHLIQAAGIVIKEFDISPRQVSVMLGDLLGHQIDAEGPRYIPSSDELNAAIQ